MASQAASQEKALDYLPDSSEELARAADLTVTHEGAQLHLHSAVLACGSRVLREALCGGASGGGAPAKAAAVQQAFEGHSLADVRLFLKLLYSETAVFSVTSFQGVLPLVDKLDCPMLLQACDLRLQSLATTSTFTQTTGTDWAGWLHLADRYGLTGIKPKAAEKLLQEIANSGDWRLGLGKLGDLSSPTYRMLLEAAMVAGRDLSAQARHYNGSLNLGSFIPKNMSRWQKPGDLV